MDAFKRSWINDDENDFLAAALHFRFGIFTNPSPISKCSDRRREWYHSLTLCFVFSISRHYQVPHLEKHFTITVMTMTKASEFGGWVGGVTPPCTMGSRVPKTMLRNWRNLQCIQSAISIDYFHLSNTVLGRFWASFVLVVGVNRVPCLLQPPNITWLRFQSNFSLDSRAGAPKWGESCVCVWVCVSKLNHRHHFELFSISSSYHRHHPNQHYQSHSNVSFNIEEIQREKHLPVVMTATKVVGTIVEFMMNGRYHQCQHFETLYLTKPPGLVIWII